MGTIFIERESMMKSCEMVEMVESEYNPMVASHLFLQDGHMFIILSAQCFITAQCTLFSILYSSSAILLKFLGPNSSLSYLYLSPQDSNHPPVFG